ncbi:MAG: hypothetical protein Sv326_0490 [Candidatus Fermentimicrarchaeum limneticum]|uniref:Uncharacterized protein n=1 Tax=Fermentimicrarchaeum limneticum TaxID=2795018 RepID=A0A7D5XC20_FERL1|nr:MAG: hypothetical protein Sv326_0490 [Candidatus Fermentimicrarchaeum limneticum]
MISFAFLPRKKGGYGVGGYFGSKGREAFHKAKAIIVVIFNFIFAPNKSFKYFNSKI